MKLEQLKVHKVGNGGNLADGINRQNNPTHFLNPNYN
jgi:hypothetical protein